MNQVTGIDYQKTGVMVAVLLLLFFVSQEAMAASAGGGLPFEGWLTKLQNSITGPYAFTAAILGMVGAGSTLIFGGDMNGVMRTLLFLVLALCFLVAAQNTVQTITGKGAEITHSYSSSIGAEG